MGTKPVTGKSMEERIELKRELEENQKKDVKNNVPLLPYECVFDIIVKLPLESLQSSMFVCKSWYRIVNSRAFIDAHLRRSDIGLIFLTSVDRGNAGKILASPASKIKSFSVESKVSELQSKHAYHWPLIDPPPLFRMKFMEIKDGKSKMTDYNTYCMGLIRAACNGLIILDNRMKKGGLIVFNPVTRDLKTIPFGTRCSPNNESYGLGICPKSRKFKLVHLFRDELNYIGCEVIDIGDGSWRVAAGPSHGDFGWLGYKPVFALGALHWIPHVNHNEYMMSMLLDDEKFRKILLPKSAGIHDRVFEMLGFLGFGYRRAANKIDVWILRGLRGEAWEKQYSISLSCKRNMIPLCCMRNHAGLVFKCESGDLYAYDQRLQHMTKIKAGVKFSFSVDCSFPHVNSLISWRI